MKKIQIFQQNFMEKINYQLQKNKDFSNEIPFIIIPSLIFGKNVQDFLKIQF